MKIRETFAAERPIDREIEKVIRIEAASEEQLAAEIGEYEVTPNVESNFRRFLDAFGDGIRLGHETEMGVWVSGFYGSGKSSFTKYLAMALDRGRTVKGRRFLDHLRDRFASPELKALLTAVGSAEDTAVVTLDLGEQMQVAKHNEPVSTVLYWRVLNWAGYSEIKEIADLELEWEQHGEADRLKKAVEAEANLPWEQIHNDPLLCKPLVSGVLHKLQPARYATPDTFAHLKYEVALDVQGQAKRIVDVVRRRSGKKTILFVVDEAGQYVAPSADRILNLDGFCRALKGIGQGKVWLLATGQQTLTEIFTRAALNSPELFKLRDRFPISVELSPNDIREITHRRLLAKSATGTTALREIFGRHGESARTFTRLEQAPRFDSALEQDRFVRFYPFLPQHFDILMALTRSLARSTGGIGLRSAIRVIQDVLVDKSRTQPAGAALLADDEVGRLATVDRFYDTLREDLRKWVQNGVEGVEKVEQVFAGDELRLRLAKAIAALQAVEGLPRTPENLAALLYARMGDPSCIDQVRVALKDMEESRDCNLIDDPSTDGYQFVSSAVRDFKRRRNVYVPDQAELNDVRRRVWLGEASPKLFADQPQGRLGTYKQVSAKVRVGAITIHPGATLELLVEQVPPEGYEARKSALLSETRDRAELQNTVVWLAPMPAHADELAIEIVRSLRAANVTDDRADPELLQFARNEKKRAERLKDELAKLCEDALMQGTLVFRAAPVPAREAGQTLSAAAAGVLSEAAKKVFHRYALADIKPDFDMAPSFLKVEALRHITTAQDPLRFVVQAGGNAVVDVSHRVLAEVLSDFGRRAAGVGRLTGGQVFEALQREPYGWGQDAVRYIFAALLTAGALKVFGTADKDPITTRGPRANEVFKSNDSFKKSGFALREASERPAMDVLLRAADNLEQMVGDIGQINPLEDVLARTVQAFIPNIADAVSPLETTLRLLGLPGSERARKVADELGALTRGDGTNAAFLLGDPATTLPSDLRWAQKAQKALTDGGEGDVKAAQQLVRDLAGLEELDAGLTVRSACANRLATVSEVLGSETFADRVADLRSGAQFVRAALAECYRDRRAVVESDCADALRAVENTEGWDTLAEQDREELGGRLSPALPEPDESAVPDQLRAAILVHLRLPAIVVAVQKEIALRQPSAPEPPPGEPEPTPPSAVSVRIRVPRRTVRSAGDVKQLLADLGTRLESELVRHGIIEVSFEAEARQ